MSVLIRNARVLTFDAADTEPPRADILVRGTTIAAVGPDLPPPDEPDLRWSMPPGAWRCRGW